MIGIGNTKKRRACTLSLHRALAESCRIRELMVIEDIINVEALHARMESAELGTFYRFGVNVLYFHPLYEVIVSRFSIIDVYSKQISVQADIQFLTLAIVMGKVEMVYVKCISEEYPSPTEVRTHLKIPLRGKGYAHVVIVSYTVYLMCVGVLEHCRIVVFLWFYVSGVYQTEPFEEMDKSTAHSL